MSNEEIEKAFEGRWRMKGDSTLTMMHNALDNKLTLQELSVEIAALCLDFFEAGCELSAYHKEKKLSDAAQLTVRSNKFFESLNTPENVSKYGTQMLSSFFEYWTEPNPSRTKMRFELQKTWDLNRRLARWARNNFNRYDRQQPTNDNLSKLTEILIG